MIFRHLILVVAVMVATSVSRGADDDKCPSLPKWGKISKDELLMTRCADAPEADAIILMDKVDIEIVMRNDLYLEFKHRVRIKILTDNGKEYGDIRIPYWHKDKIKDVKAHTILPNGKKIKLKGGNIYDEEVDRYKVKVFTMPGLQKGAIIEYRYRKKSESIGYLTPWEFQNDLYTKRSQVSVLVPPGFIYKAFKKNIKLDEISDYTQEKISFDNKRPSKIYTWIMYKVPALKDEVFINNLDDYRKEISFQIVGYRDRTVNYTFIEKWDDLAGQVRDFSKGYLKKKREINELVHQLTDTCTTDDGKARAIYNYIRVNIVNDEYRGIINDDFVPIKKVLADNKGSRVEKNWTMLHMMKLAGLKVEPLLISTRSNGRIDQQWPKLSQFNRVVVAYGKSPRIRLLDASYTHVPFNILPSQDICNVGFLVTDDEYRMINIPNPKFVNMYYANSIATVDEEGNLACKSTLRYENYRAISMRYRIKDDGVDKFVENLLESRFEELNIDSIRVENLDNVDEPLHLHINFTVPEFWQDAGGLTFFTPALFHRQQSNPFTRTKRDLPIEFSYVSTENEVVQWIFPEGFIVDELPQPMRINSRHHIFSYHCQGEKNTLDYARYFSIKKDSFPAKAFTAMKDNYDRIVEIDQGQVVLKIKQSAADNSNE